MKRGLLKTTSLCLMLAITPVQAKHHSGHDPAKDIADRATHGILDSIKKTFTGLLEALTEQNKIAKAIKDGVMNRDFKIDNLAEGWANDFSSDMLNTFDNKLHQYASDEMTKYQDLRKLYGKDNQDEVAYQYALVTETSKQSAKDTDKRLKKHASNIKKLSKENGKTEDLKSAQDLSNQHNTEQSILLAELLREQSITNRQLSAQHEFELNEQRRKVRFHDFGSR